MTNNKQYFTTIEVLERAKEELEYRDHDDMVESSELVEVVALVDYYIVYTHEAINALDQYGTWDAIGEVQEYENENYGEVFTDLGSPEEVATALWKIIASTTIYELNLDGLEVSEALEIINEELEHVNN